MQLKQEVIEGCSKQEFEDKIEKTNIQIVLATLMRQLGTGVMECNNLTKA